MADEIPHTTSNMTVRSRLSQITTFQGYDNETLDLVQFSHDAITELFTAGYGDWIIENDIITDDSLSIIYDLRKKNENDDTIRIRIKVTRSLVPNMTMPVYTYLLEII